jgi:hypothetical protein
MIALHFQRLYTRLSAAEVRRQFILTILDTAQDVERS